MMTILDTFAALYTKIFQHENLIEMALPDVFSKAVTDGIIARIQKLDASTQPLWGKMSVAQMLAHCGVTYEMVYEHKHPKPGALMRLILKLMVKNSVVNEVPYKQSLPTARQFLISDERQFEVEKARLIGFLKRTQQLGGAHFDGKESHSFGRLSRAEWNNMFYKHLDHHLRQFGV